MIAVVAIVPAKPGEESKLAQIFMNLSAQVRANEPGNRRYDVFQSLADPTKILIYEEYLDQAALDAHAASDHFKQGNAELRPLVAARAEIHRYHDPQQ